ncbi:MAG TPA: hypothetical protein VNP73_04310 [Actinomycetota bacterium]|nr:hypothetical protein [Actinomycetota bacterium]
MLIAYRGAAEMVGWDTLYSIRSFFHYSTRQLEALMTDANLRLLQAENKNKLFRRD